ncbi:MAG: DNA replication and repair protein RecF, partial [Bacteroidota bacterium]|nr:DNA replication and repair protein RecF [Bacteroidota bacterium]
MYLQKLSIVNFKNYTDAELKFSEKINCFVGNNGAGKTNLLDAIYYLSFCKSFINPVDSQNIHDNDPFFVINGDFGIDDKTENVYCGLKRNQRKQFKLNKKEYSRFADHIGLFPLVMISPFDTNLIYDGSEERRKFIDTVISQYNKNYLNILINYNKVLLQRNTLLKQMAEKNFFDRLSLDIWNEQIIEYGNVIHSIRKNFTEEFSPVFKSYYEYITENKETIELKYNSQLNEADFSELLEKSLEKDRATEYTHTGIHKDDLELLISGNQLKKFGSQGQQKSFVIALKLAQFE